MPYEFFTILQSGPILGNIFSLEISSWSDFETVIEEHIKQPKWKSAMMMRNDADCAFGSVVTFSCMNNELNAGRLRTSRVLQARK